MAFLCDHDFPITWHWSPQAYPYWRWGSFTAFVWWPCDSIRSLFSFLLIPSPVMALLRICLLLHTLRIINTIFLLMVNVICDLFRSFHCSCYYCHSHWCHTVLVLVPPCEWVSPSILLDSLPPLGVLPPATFLGAVTLALSTCTMHFVPLCFSTDTGSLRTCINFFCYTKCLCVHFNSKSEDSTTNRGQSSHNR